MLETARWLVVFVSAVTAVGGLGADWFVPFGARQHLRLLAVAVALAVAVG